MDLLRNDMLYDVFLARNGKEGLLACRDHPDIIILDVDMPGGMSGFKVLEALREDWDSRELPIIMLASTPPLLGEQTAMNFGVSHYLTKPWSVGTVETAVRVALREAKVSKGEGDNFSDYLKPKKKKKEPPKAQPDGTLPAVIDDRGHSPDEKTSATTTLAEPDDDLGDDEDDE